jgi:hypothetical protein
VEKNQRKNLKNKFSEEDKKKDNHNCSGLCGLYTAFLLQQKGIEVLKEANDRIEA